MTMKQQLAAAVMFMLGGCTWRPSSPDDCARLASSPAFAEAQRLAAVASVGEITVTHQLCANRMELLAGLPQVRHDEVGWCAHIEEPLPARSAQVRDAALRQCAVAVSRGAFYMAWSSLIGREHLYATTGRYLISPLPPGV